VSVSAIVTQRKRKTGSQLADHAEDLRNFAIFIPAHNEESVISSVLESLLQLDYPRELYRVYVIADNCTDGTAALAGRFNGVEAWERFDQDERGKGYALRWMWQQLAQRQIAHDAYLVIDADSVVDASFLQAVNQELQNGALALQGRNMVLNATESPSAALRWLALALMNYVRQLGRGGWGGSSSLLGNGMCFSQELIERYPWEAFSLGEDFQYYLMLVEQGVRVGFVPEAVVLSQMPLTFKQMRSQDVRWEATDPEQPSWKTIGRLLRGGLRERSIVRLDAAAEMLTPPLSVLVAACGLLTVTALLLGLRWEFLVALLSCAGTMFYIATAFYLLRPPAAVYKSLWRAPGFMLWKLWVILVLAKSRKHTQEWVRTARNPS
jgi:cellulose synthase/poly-beta-1,6-N-acetylglucosamine synthase-like glycosyltransferase